MKPRSDKNFLNTLLAIIGFFFLIFYQLSVSKLDNQYVGFQKNTWDKTQNCKISRSNYLVQGNNRFNVLKITPSSKPFSCTSKELKNNSEILTLEYRGLSNKVFFSVLSETSNNPLKTFTVEATNEWQKINLKNILNESFNIKVGFQDNNNKEQWLEVRNRIESYNKKSLLRNIIQNSSLKKISPLIGALGLIFIFIYLSNKNNNPFYLFLFFLVVSILIHFRLETFFYLDEWHTIRHFTKTGLSGVIFKHNEHFLPIFFFIYYLESKLFGLNYEYFLLISHIFHALNTLILFLLLSKIFSNKKNINNTALIISFLFLVNSNQAETLQWAFVQCVILVHTAIFSGIYFGIKYIESNKKIFLHLSYLFIGASPLIFANGFIGIFLLFLVLTLLFYLNDKKYLLNKNTKQLLIATFIATATSASFYYLYGIDKSQSLTTIFDHFRYIATGTFVGTFLRGLGLFPSLKLEGVSIVSKQLPNSIFQIANSFSSLDAFYWSISIIIITILFFLSREFKIKNKLIVYSIGIIWSMSFFILPALGRAQFGPSQALALRYHYGSLFGLMLIIFPTCSYLLKKPKLLICIFVLIFTFHLKTEANYKKYTSIGNINRLYITKLKDWRSLIDLEKNEPFRFDARRTKWEGQQPRWTTTITTGVNSEIIYETISWLEGKENQDAQKERLDNR